MQYWPHPTTRFPKPGSMHLATEVKGLMDIITLHFDFLTVMWEERRILQNVNAYSLYGNIGPILGPDPLNHYRYHLDTQFQRKKSLSLNPIIIINFEKALNTISWRFMYKTLEFLNVRHNFLNDFCS